MSYKSIPFKKVIISLVLNLSLIYWYNYNFVYKNDEHLISFRCKPALLKPYFRFSEKPVANKEVDFSIIIYMNQKLYRNDIRRRISFNPLKAYFTPVTLFYDNKFKILSDWKLYFEGEEKVENLVTKVNESETSFEIKINKLCNYIVLKNKVKLINGRHSIHIASPIYPTRLHFLFLLRKRIICHVRDADVRYYNKIRAYHLIINKVIVPLNVELFIIIFIIMSNIYIFYLRDYLINKRPCAP